MTPIKELEEIRKPREGAGVLDLDIERSNLENVTTG